MGLLTTLAGAAIGEREGRSPLKGAVIGAVAGRVIRKLGPAGALGAIGLVAYRAYRKAQAGGSSPKP